VIELQTVSGRGRGKNRTFKEAQALVAAWKSSGESPQRWCESQGLLRSALSSCRRRVDIPACNPSCITKFVEIIPKAMISTRVRLTVTSSGALVDLSLSELVGVIQALAGRTS